MESQNDQFPKIKCNSSQQSRNSKHKHHVIKQAWRTYPTGEQKGTINFIAVVNCLHLLPIVASYMLLSKSNNTISIELKDKLRMTQRLDILFLLISLVIKFLVFLTIYLDFKICRGKNIHNLLVRLAEYLRSYLRIMVQVDLLASSFFLLTLTPLSCINFALSAVIVVFSILFLQNYSTRKDTFLVGSILFNTILRAKIIIGSIVGLFCMIFEQSSISMALFLSTHAIIAIVVIYAYFQQGFTIYRNYTLRWGVFLSLSAYLSLSATMIIGEISDSDIRSFAINYILIVFAVSVYLYHKMVGRKAVIVSISTNICLQAFQIMQILDESSYDAEKQALINGFLNIHSLVTCINPHCQLNSQKTNEIKTNQSSSAADSIKDKTSCVHFHIKCKYQQFLENFPNDYNIMLKYAEFLYHQMNNVDICMHYLKKIDLNKIKLNWTNKLKLDRLSRTIYEENKYFCQHLYDGKLEIEEVVKAEQVNQAISEKTIEILKYRMHIWELFESQEIDISQIRDRMQKIMNDLQLISSQWKEISKFIQRAQKWKFQYVCFLLFLKNERLKTKFIDDLLIDTSDKKLFVYQAEKGTNTIANSLFDPNSCCIHTEIKEGNVFIKKVSRNCQNVTGYTNNQIDNANLSIMMPALIAQKHAQMLVKLSQKGQFSSQSNYKMQQVYIVNKRGFIVPVLKIYKQLITLQGQLQYVCFIKKIKQEDSMLLCDDNFDILGITEKFSDIISEEGNNGQPFKGANLLSLVPGLTSLTKFKYAANTEEHQGQFLAYQRNEQHCLELNDSPSNIQQILDTLFQLTYPTSSVLKYTEIYLQLCKNKKNDKLENVFQRIVQAAKIIRNNQHIIFTCLFSFKRMHNDYDMDYFQVKLRKIRQSPTNIIIAKPKGIEEPAYFQQLAGQKILDEQNGREFDISSISAKTNIYLKQEINEAPKNNVCLKYLKYLWIALFIQLTAVAIANMSLSKKQFSNMAVSINNIYQSGQVSITSSRLINLYIAKLLNITTVSSIPETTQRLQNFINDPLMHQAFFDKAINPPSTFYASSDIAQNYTGYNEIDFLFFIESVFQTLAEPQQITANSSLYILIMDYQYPPLNDFLNRTNINLSIEFNRYEKKLEIQSTLVFTLELVVILVSAILVRTFSFKFYNSMFEMVKIHCRFTRSDIDNNLRYIRKIIEVFQDLEYSEYANASSLPLAARTSHSAKVSLINNKLPQSSNLNKKSKKIVIGRTLQRKKLLYYVKVIGCFIVFTCTSVSRNLYLMDLKTSASNQKFIGQNFFNFIPSQYLTGQIMAEAYSADAVPAYFPDQYLPLLSNLQIQANMPYIFTPQSDTFSQLNKQFSFGDACAISVQSLNANNISLKECYQTANHSLSGGLQQYSRYQYDMVRRFFNSTKSFSFKQLSQYFRSIDIYHTINNFMVQTWAKNYVSLTTEILANIDDNTLLSLCAILLMTILYKIFLFDYMQKEYELYYFLYANMMPEEVVSREKIIRSQLSEINFL